MEFFITGTGTGIGKTFVTALLAHAFLERGFSTGIQKWVSTGNRETAEDLDFIRSRVPGIEKQAVSVSCMQAVYCLEFPASPHLAAEKEDVSILPEKILDNFQHLKGQFDILMVEGAGGLMVPVTRDVLLIDILKESGMPAVVVAASGLGTINHTLLSLEALERRGIPCAGVVLNSQGWDTSFEEHADIVEDNARVIEEFSHVKVLGLLPRMDGFDDAAMYASDIARNLLDNYDVLHR